MLAAARISAMRGLMKADDEQALAQMILAMGPLPAVADLRIAEALAAVSHDKKVVNGRLHFVLARGIGSTEIVSDVTTDELALAMRQIGLR